YFVPSMLRVMLDEPALAECRALRRVICGGEALPAETMRRFYAQLGAELHHSYGPTETSIAATEWTCAPDAARVTMGRPLANTTLYVLADGMRPVPVGVPGELYVGGDGVGRGYLGRADLTAAAFIPDPFASTPGARLYKTGDLVRYLPDGNVEFLGRVDDQIKIRGYRIELGEIESVMARHAAVAEAVALAREDAPGQKRLVAYVVPAGGAAPTTAELRDHAAMSLPDYMVPATFVLLDAPPLLPSGKIDRRALPAPEQAASVQEENYVAPRTPAEEVLAGLWAQVLGVARVGLHDNFFDLGGHSLLATQLISRVRQTFNVELGLRDLFAAPTVGQLSELVERELRAGREVQDNPVVRAERDGDLPLSFAQQRLWFLNRLDPESSFYNIAFSPRLAGRLNVEALRRGFSEVYARHESLRTTFPVVDGQPVQLIAPPGEFELPLIDLSDLPEGEREERARELLTASARLHFDLGAGPLMRALLVRTGPDMHVLGVTMHHIVSDGWSIGVLVSELAAAYGAFDRGAQPALPELTIHYADYAAWQREQLQGEPLERLLAFWRAQLTGAPPALDLPTDRPRLAVQSYNGSSHSFNFPSTLLGRLRDLSRGEGVTLYMTLVAAFQLLLSRYSGQTDVVIGTPIANRTRVETEGLIGCFVNTLALRTDLSGDITFRELLKRVRETTLGAYAHQDVPFEKLVEELQPERDLTRSPLFQVMFVLQNASNVALELPGLSL
ncbi:MAG TPA: condensation domain-containing protein, partial [Pyrinomonadaceae bacterium]